MKFWLLVFVHLFFVIGKSQTDFDLISAEKVNILNANRHWPVSNAIESSFWYEPSEAIDYHSSGKGEYRYQFLFPDTQGLVVVPFSTGSAAVTIKNASLGYIFDPRSDLYKLHPNSKLNSWNSYTIDSVWFFYRYYRFTIDTNIVDTLVVSFFDKSAIQKGFESQYAAAVNYNYKNNAPYGQNVVEHTILLHHSNQSRSGNNLIVPLNMKIAGTGIGSNWFGTALQFKPGYSAYKSKAIPDTIANFNTLDSSNKFCNIFRLLCYQDMDKYIESSYIPPLTQFSSRVLNHGIIATEIQRYRLPGANGMVDDFYYPAFYANYNLIPVIDVHVNVNNLGSKNPEIKHWVQDGDMVKFYKNSTYCLYDLAGKCVIKGEGLLLELTSVPVGIYVLRVSNSTGYISSIISK